MFTILVRARCKSERDWQNPNDQSCKRRRKTNWVQVQLAPFLAFGARLWVPVFRVFSGEKSAFISEGMSFVNGAFMKNSGCSSCRADGSRATLRTLVITQIFSRVVKSFYSFAHPHQPVPAAPDGLPTGHSVSFARQETTQPRRGH